LLDKKLKTVRNHWALDLLGGCSGIAIALGLIRFDFGILGSLMAHAKWIEVEDIGKLAAINMFGYLAGCIQQASIKSRSVSIRYLRIAIFVIIISMIFEGRLINFQSQLILRLLCGWGAAHLVSGLPTLALERVPQQWRRKATGGMMCGGGIGALLGAIAIGTYSPTSAANAWAIVAVLTIALSLPTLELLSRRGQHKNNNSESAESTIQDNEKTNQNHHKSRTAKSLIPIIILGFALMQVGQVPAILYEPLVAINKIGLTSKLSSSIDSLFGVGLILGGLIPTLTPAKLTTKAFLPIISMVGLLGVVLFGFANSAEILSLSIFLIGIWDMMTGTLTLDRLGELCDEDAQRRTWATATSVGALGFIIFSSATSHLSRENIGLILTLGVAVVAMQVGLEWIQYAISSNQTIKRRKHTQPSSQQAHH